MGLCGAMALAYYLECGDTTLLGAHDVETHTGLPLLGAVPILHRTTIVRAK